MRYPCFFSVTPGYRTESAGNHQIAAIEESIVVAFTAARTPDNTRLVAILNYAYRVSSVCIATRRIHSMSLQHARQGKYEEAVSMLLDPDVWIGLEIADYQMWATQIWHIFVLRASRRYKVFFDSPGIH